MMKLQITLAPQGAAPNLGNLLQGMCKCTVVITLPLIIPYLSNMPGDTKDAT